MKTSEIFDALLEGLRVGGLDDSVAARRDEITKALNKDFRDKTGSIEHRLMVGSYGRHTAIRGVSDLDMIFIVPAGLRANFDGENGPRRLLERVRDVLKDRYKSTEVRVDQCVVRVQFASNKFKFEVQPAFENSDGTFDYPDSVDKAWKLTKPRAEIIATRESNDRTRMSMRHLARMARAWKNTNGVALGGLVVDTLVHRFFENNDTYDALGTGSYDALARDFFAYLKDEPNHDFYLALGSKQRVKVRSAFQAKAKKAHKRCVEAIEDAGAAKANKKWRLVFGASVPLSAKEVTLSFNNTEEFIENRHPVDINASLTIDCDVEQKGWRPASLRQMLSEKKALLPRKELTFKVTSNTAMLPYEYRWKVLNQGPEAERRDLIRGQIVNSTRPGVRTERTSFRGEHVVECYVLKDGVIVARDRIFVPISATEDG